ncbi:MAG: DUF4333 domain-containing protein [Solirubrobacteraceae bacterium]
MQTKAARLAPVLPLAAALAAGCGTTTLDTDGAEKQIAAGIEKQTGVKLRKVDCPSDVEAKKGKTFHCTLTAPNGQKIGLTAVQTSDDGRFRYTVDRGAQ